MIHIDNDICLRNDSVIGVSVESANLSVGNEKYYNVVLHLISGKKYDFCKGFQSEIEARKMRNNLATKLFGNDTLSLRKECLSDDLLGNINEDVLNELKLAGIEDMRDLVTRVNQKVLIDKGLFSAKEFSSSELEKIKSARKILLENIELFVPLLKVVKILGDDLND